ncbi:MFS transporter [Flavobacterium sp.]|uniref:MFS transporter n=1 Tax=Flavobacterium sp. TaxID=239 RepID=UPI003D0FB091
MKVELYLKTLKRLPVEAWYFALVVLINRIGAMVVPFLSKYLHDERDFSLPEIGWILVFFGIGSFLGILMSGRIIEQFGAYKVMVSALLINGIILFLLQFLYSFWLLCIGVLVLTFFADMVRPSMSVLINDYVTKPERVKAMSLIRSMSNFGFVVSPFLAIAIINFWSYQYLFVIDGITSILAVILFTWKVKQKKLLYQLKFKNLDEDKFPFLKDSTFLLHCFVNIITGIVFFQLFTIFPIYQKEVLKLDDFYSGLFLSLYGLILFVFEVYLVFYFQMKRIKKLQAVLYGLTFITLGYLALALSQSIFALFLFIILISIGVIFNFPFASDFALDRAHKNKEGIFMAIFQLSFSVSHIFSAKVGMLVVDTYGFRANWFLDVALGLLAISINFYLVKHMLKERRKIKEDMIKSIFKPKD